jgi:hypothetical protein
VTTCQNISVAATLTAGPFGQLLAIQPQGLGDAAVAMVAAGAPATLQASGTPGATGLNFTGIAAVLAALNTYYSGLSAAKRAQLGYGKVTVSQFMVSVPCHNLDVSSLAATLAGILSTSGNYGAVGT